MFSHPTPSLLPDICCTNSHWVAVIPCACQMFGLPHHPPKGAHRRYTRFFTNEQRQAGARGLRGPLRATLVV